MPTVIGTQTLPVYVRLGDVECHVGDVELDVPGDQREVTRILVAAIRAAADEINTFQQASEGSSAPS